jgi:hypothetical protein
MVLTNIIALDIITLDSSDDDINTAVTSRWTTVFEIAL